MSKSLHDQIKSNIRRKHAEELKRKQQEEEAKAKKGALKKQAEKDKAKKYIMGFLDEQLDYLLPQLRDCFGERDMAVPENGVAFDIYEDMAYELGFNVKSNAPYSLFLSIPAFEKGTKRTPVQLKFFHFQQEVAKARKERKAELLCECERVKALIKEGSYDYSVCSADVYTISVETGVWLNNAFDREVVRNFFSKLKFHLKRNDAGTWVFDVC